MTNFEQTKTLVKEITMAQGGHNPQLFAFTEKGVALLILDDLPSDHDQKVFLFRLAGAKLANSTGTEQINELHFVSEAWFSIQKNEQEFIQPSQDPDKKEAIIIVGKDYQNNTSNMSNLEMIRDTAGKLIELKDTGNDEEQSFESPLLDAFKQGFEEARDKKLLPKGTLGATIN